MINLQYIKSFYPSKEQLFEQYILKEYLQFLILDIVFSSKYWEYLSFLGETAIRIVYNSTRFSEDLDFDNFWLDEKKIDELSKIIKLNLEKNWFEVEIKNVYKWAYRCYIKIPKILKQFWFSDLEDEKILIQIDTVQQDYIYKLDKKTVDKFGIYKIINVCPIDIILSKKIHALIGRKTTKWRDIFDIIFLYKMSKPNFDYLNIKIWIKNDIELKRILNDFIKKLNLDELSKDVRPFLINPDESNKVTFFKEFINNL